MCLLRLKKRPDCNGFDRNFHTSSVVWSKASLGNWRDMYLALTKNNKHLHCNRKVALGTSHLRVIMR